MLKVSFLLVVNLVALSGLSIEKYRKLIVSRTHKAAFIISQEDRDEFQTLFSNSSNKKDENINYRLPKTIKPLEYSLEMITYLDEVQNKTFSFDGVVRIKISLEVATENITLHSKKLKIKNIELTSSTENVELMTPKYEKKTDFLILIALNKNIRPGNYTLKISYEGKVRRGLVGFFKDSYKNAQGKTRRVSIKKYVYFKSLA